MLREKFLFDNPFRLLNLSVGDDYQALRAQAAAAASAAKVGLAPDVPLAELFGTDLEDLPTRLRTLATDPKLLTLYRIFWKSAPEDAFLDGWYAFLQTHDVADFRRTVYGLIALRRSESRATDLVQPLLADGLDEATARTAVDNALSAAASHVFARAIEVATEQWTAGRYADVEKLIPIARKLELDEAAEAEGLRPLTDLGDRLAESLEQTPVDTSGPVPLYTELNALAIAVGRHPRAGRWQDVALEHLIGVAHAIRNEAIDLANEKGDHENAQTLLERALSLVPAGNTADQLAADLEVVRRNVSGAGQGPWREIRPMNGVPNLHTVNGIGFRLYGNKPFAGDARLHFAIYYFVVLFLPIIPMGRYLITREGESFRFFGRGYWTKAMKIHLGVALALMAGAVIAIVNAPNTTRSSDSSYSSYSSSEQPIRHYDYIAGYNDHSVPANSAFAQSAPAKKTDPKVLALDNKLNRLSKEVEDLGSQMETLKKELGAMKPKINRYLAEIRAHNLTHARQYERLFRFYNSKVTTHNSLLKTYQAKLKQYKSLSGSSLLTEE